MEKDGALRVTMLGSLPPDKGVSQYCLGLASALAERNDLRLHVLAFRDLYPARLYPGGSPQANASRVSEVAGARVERSLRWWNPLGWLAAGLTLRGDVVHAQWWSYFLAPMYVVVLSVARLRRKRIVLTVHNTDPHEGGRARRAMNRAVLPLAHHVIVHAEPNRRSLIAAGVPAERVSVVPMGVPGQPWASDDDRVAARASLAISEMAPTVLFLGNIRRYKGVEDLIEAFRIVVGDVPEARLIIAGQPWTEAPDIAAIVRRAGLQDRVLLMLEFLPEQRARDCFLASDVVVYPYTHFDAQSAAACDALGYGRAIVVSDVGGLADLASDRGAVVPPRDPRRLAEALVRVLTDAAFRARLESGAREKARAMSWDQSAAATADVYRRVAAASAAERVAPIVDRRAS